MILEAHSLAPDNSGLFTLLRDGTHDLHQRLERDLHLLASPTRERFVFVLGKFLGFHRAWERNLRRHAEFAPMLAGRSRISHIEHDLAALGADGQLVVGLPECAAAEGLSGSRERAMGSLYVMEGSTLGGAVIARALQRQAWVPADGLHYFAPPGRQVHADWLALKQWAAAAVAREAWPAVVQGARDTFEVLGTWISGPEDER